MISILLHYANAQQDISAWESLSEDNTFSYPLIPLTGMLADHYHLLAEPEDLDNLEVQVGLLGGVIDYIGCFNEDGSQVVWDEDKAYRNYSLTKYATALNDIVEYDDENIEISRTPVTEEQAKNIQVNKISGWEDRDLESSQPEIIVGTPIF